MISTNNNSTTQSTGASISAFFFLMIAMFLLTGFLPQYLNYVDTDCIELSESLEDETEEGKKEKETEKQAHKYLSKFTQYELLHLGNLIALNGYFHQWQNPSADIITPPPDLSNS